MIKVYLARSMSGRSMKDVVKEAEHQRMLFEAYWFSVLDPVKEEGVKAKNKKLQATITAMKKYWPRDKAMIREAHVFVDCTPHLKSQGVEREAGYARYGLWKPVVRVFPKGEIPHPANVAHFEDDLIVDSFADAAKEIKKRWGSVFNRFNWRIKMLIRCVPKWLYYQLGEFK